MIARTRVIESVLARPASDARREWRTRTRAILTLVDADGHVGLGEIAPLPGYSRDTLEADLAALARMTWPDPPVGAGLDWIADTGRRVSADLPAARHGVESAALDLAAQRRGVPAWRLLCTEGRSMHLASLLDGDIMQSADAAYARGIRTFKLKLGRDFDAELACVRALRERFGRNIAIRLDVNQAWSIDQAARRLAALAPLAPELVEEPVADLAALPGSPVPLALDESLHAPGAFTRLEPCLRRTHVVAVVAKPMCVGGTLATLALAEAARSRGIDVIVSHLHDGPIALAAAAALAIAIGSSTLAMGLDAFPDRRVELCAGVNPGLGVPEVESG